MSADNHATQQQQFTLRLLRLNIAILQARSAAIDLGEAAIAEAIAGAHELVKAKLEMLEPYRRTLAGTEGAGQ